VGRPGLFKRYTRRDIIPIVLDLIYGAWPKVCKGATVNSTSHEPAIAGALYHELWNLKRTRRITGPPTIECEAASFSNKQLLIPDGRIDFKLIYGWQQNDYFSIECKRVSSTDTNLARLYVMEGVVRFTSGKYAAGHDWGAMLAFVIDSDPTGSATLINSKLEKLSAETFLSGGILAETSFGSRNHLYRSTHTPQHQKGLLNIIHLYVTF
jgi:hypothetical protein